MKNLFNVVRVLISVVLIGYLLTTTQLGELLTMLRAWNGLYFAVALALGAFQNVTFAYRWKVTLEVSGINVPLLTLVRFYFVGTFFNLFLPTALGGDVDRGYDLAAHSGQKMWAAVSVLVEKIIGSLALATIALLALFSGGSRINNASVSTVLLFLCLACLAFVVTTFNARIMKRFIRLLNFVKLWNLNERLSQIYDALHEFSAHKALLSLCFGLSVVGQTLLILAVHSLAIAINLELSAGFFFIAVPMIWIITMVPFSISGRGVREAAFVFFFTKVGALDSEALLLAFLNFSLIVLGLVGGIIYLYGQLTPLLEMRQHSTRR